MSSFLPELMVLIPLQFSVMCGSVTLPTTNSTLKRTSGGKVWDFDQTYVRGCADSHLMLLHDTHVIGSKDGRAYESFGRSTLMFGID
ncbi:hypothetical protein EV363DRAFT_13593 [Boletus edulis]|nr:hypothetical protein EV363DRAFT_13593 [Boletus edulis]